VRTAALLLAILVTGCAAADAGFKPKPKPVRVAQPGPLTLAPNGTVVVGDRQLRRVVRVNPRTKKRTVIASGFPSAIVGLGYDDTGRLYVSAGDRVYRMDGTRKTLVAGTGTRGHTGDGGPATEAQLGGATGIDVDHDEKLLVTEYDNWIRVVSPEGTISTVAGNGGTGYAGDGGPATDALLGHPHDAIWRIDGIVIADSHNGVLRKVDEAGRITTLASGFFAPVELAGAPGDAILVADASLGVFSVSREGAKRLLAVVPTPVAVVGDNDGNVYATLLELRRVVKISPAGRVTRLVN
jgi:hypothetical protein